MDPSIFETLTPSRYITFKLPLSSLPITSNPYFHTPNLQFSVLDSPTHSPNTPLKLAVMLVPHRRENDWIFTTLAGHLQLLLSSPQIISRLILIGNDLNFAVNGVVENDPKDVRACLLPSRGDVGMPLLRYDDNVSGNGMNCAENGVKMGKSLVENDHEDAMACSLPSEGDFEISLSRYDGNVAGNDSNRVESCVKMEGTMVKIGAEDARACFSSSGDDFEIPLSRYEDDVVGNSSNCVINGEKMDKTMVENDREDVLRCLYPLLVGFLPKGGDLEIPLLRYEDNVLSSVVVEVCNGDCVGEMLVVDVDIEGFDREVRRRLIFKRMPNLVQSEVRVLSSGGVDLGVLVHPYLAPMVAGVCLIGGVVQEKFGCGIKPKACCIGVGGGALVSFLSGQLGFEVLGVEIDEVVLRVAKEYFGLETNECIQVHVGDGIEFLRMMSDSKKEIFDVMMVDLDSADPSVGVSAPALEFMRKDVFLAAKSCLFEHGVLVLNVIMPNRRFYDILINDLRDVFVELYEIDCGNEENVAVIASKSSIDYKVDMSENAFLRKLKSVISGAFMDSIRKI